MKRSLIALLLLMPMLGWADDVALTEVLAHIRHGGSAKFQYRESRRMELVAEPVQAQGYMLTDADGTLVKLQLQPNRVIMAIAGQSMFYWDPAQKQRHVAPLGYGGAAAQQIEVFRSVLQGRVDELQAVYDFSAESHDRQWLLRMTPKPEQGDRTPPLIEISGDADHGKRKLLIRQADGEETEYLIVKVSDDQAGDHTIAALLREATGD